MNPHFCRVGRIIPNVSKLISLKELETKITNFVDDVSKIDKDTLAVKEFNDMVQNDDRVENVMIPLRDGLILIQKVC